jgi:hypothetical protein
MRLAGLVCGAFAALAAAICRADVSSIDPDSTSQITDQINSDDDAQIDAAEQQIADLLQGHHAPTALHHDWVPALIRLKKYDDALHLIAAGINASPATTNAQALLRSRTQVLLALDRPQEALESAKSYYNVCEISMTDDAIGVIEQCLIQIHPNDVASVRRFRLEQATESMRLIGPIGLDSNPSSEPSSSESTPLPFLKDIPIELKPYEIALDFWRVRHSFKSQLYYANLLLITDQGVKAEAVFRELYLAAADQNSIDIATEGIARALRAEDGTLARANAWLAARSGG